MLRLALILTALIVAGCMLPPASTALPPAATPQNMPSAPTAMPPAATATVNVTYAARLRSGPGMDYPTADFILNGASVETLSLSPDRQWIETPHGWIHRGLLAEIPSDLTVNRGMPSVNATKTDMDMAQMPAQPATMAAGSLEKPIRIGENGITYDSLAIRVVDMVYGDRSKRYMEFKAGKSCADCMVVTVGIRNLDDNPVEFVVQEDFYLLTDRSPDARIAQQVACENGGLYSVRSQAALRASIKKFYAGQDERLVHLCFRDAGLQDMPYCRANAVGAYTLVHSPHWTLLPDEDQPQRTGRQHYFAFDC